MVRAATDPDDTDPRGGGVRGQSSKNPGGVQNTTAETWERRLLEALADSGPRTFQRLSVELTGRSADAMFETNLDRALWQLVRAEALEHTPSAPVLFRRRAGSNYEPPEQLALFG